MNQKSPDTRYYVTVTQAAKLTGRHPGVIRHWIRQGKLKTSGTLRGPRAGKGSTQVIRLIDLYDADIASPRILTPENEKRVLAFRQRIAASRLENGTAEEDSPDDSDSY